MLTLIDLRKLPPHSELINTIKWANCLPPPPKKKKKLYTKLLAYQVVITYQVEKNKIFI